MPLLARLAHAGYYEDRVWGEHYGDEALDALEDSRVSARRGTFAASLGRWLGWGSSGILVALVRFRLAPARERRYSFGEMLGPALRGGDDPSPAPRPLSLRPRAGDARRRGPVALLGPSGAPHAGRHLRVLPRHARDRRATTGDGVCDVRYAARERSRIPLLSDPSRRTRASFTSRARTSPGARSRVFREDGRGALESADALDASGLKLYAMIASQLRFLYFTLNAENSRRRRRTASRSSCTPRTWAPPGRSRRGKPPRSSRCIRTSRTSSPSPGRATGSRC